jgi:hypothetical protein
MLNCDVCAVHFRKRYYGRGDQGNWRDYRINHKSCTATPITIQESHWNTTTIYSLGRLYPFTGGVGKRHPGAGLQDRREKMIVPAGFPDWIWFNAGAMSALSVCQPLSRRRRLCETPVHGGERAVVPHIAGEDHHRQIREQRMIFRAAHHRTARQDLPQHA